MSDRDAVYEEVMAMSEGEIQAELAKEGKTMEGVAAEMQQIFERAKAEAEMRTFIRAWLKPPAGAQRPSPWALGFSIQQAAEQFLRDTANDRWSPVTAPVSRASLALAPPPHG